MSLVAWVVKCKNSNLIEQSEPNEIANNPTYWTDSFPVYSLDNISDEDILLVMKDSINYADGGYVVDTMPESVIEAGRKLIEFLKENK